MVVSLAHQEMVGEGLNAETSWELELTQLLAFTSHRVEVLQVRAIEDLDAMVPAIRDEDSLVLVVKGDAPGPVELVVCVACFSVAES